MLVYANFFWLDCEKRCYSISSITFGTSFLLESIAMSERIGSVEISVLPKDIITVVLTGLKHIAPRVLTRTLCTTLHNGVSNYVSFFRCTINIGPPLFINLYMYVYCFVITNM